MRAPLRKRLPLRTQLVVALGLVAALPVVAFGLAQSRRAEEAEVARADRETLLASTSLAHELGRVMGAHADVARALAGEIRLDGALDARRIGPRTLQYQAIFPGLYGVFVVDTRGVTVDGTLSVDGTTSVRSMAGIVYEDRGWFRQIRDGAPLASELLRSRSTGQPAIIIAAAVTDANADLIGLTGVGVELDAVRRILERVTQAAPGLAAIVLDDSARVVAAGGKRWTPLEKLGGVALYRAASGGVPEARLGPDETGELRRGTMARVESDVVHWSVMTTWPQAAVRQRGTKAIEAMVPFVVGSLVLGLCVALVLGYALARPVTRVAALIQAIGRGDLRVRPAPPGAYSPRELVELDSSIEGMLGQLRALIKQLGRTVVTVRDVTIRLGERSKQMLDDSHAQRVAVGRSSGAIVQITDSMANVGSSVLGLSQEASRTTSSIVSLDRQIDQIAESLRRLSGTIDGALAHVEETQQQVVAVAGAASDLGQNVGQTNDSLRLLTDSISGVAERAEHSRSLARAALAAADAGRGAVDETIRATQAIQRSFSAVGDAVHVLASRSEAIGGVASVLERVMHATRLLGLNASIIASEAGEHGRRFAVVADRVRTMASETASSIDQITKLVASVQSDIKQAVDAVRFGQETVHAGERRSADAGVRLHAIIECSSEAERTVQEIADATRDQSQQVRAVQAALGQVRAATDRIGSAVETQRRAQHEMALAIAQVRSVGDDVRTSIEAQQAHSQAMTAAVRAMTTRFQAIAQAIDAQNRERDRIEGSLNVFEGASKSSVEFARQLGDVVETLAERLDQLERELSAFSS
ncbi:MAG TPA: methyl-accepting chemotaxis protein [Polyangiaceae bacterium]|nr:methyl-accepting chemotaxis protein [Polyangiaceae bacterium]